MPCCHRIAALSLALAPWCAIAAPAYQLSLLPSLGGSYGTAADINNAGQIVGYSNLAGDLEGHAVLWKGATAPVDLAPGYGESTASRINDRGQIIGYPVVFYPEGLPGTYLWQQAGAKPTLLAPLSSELSGVALGINNAGQMAGVSQDSNFGQYATTWNPPRQLDAIGTAAADINNAGAITGSVRDDDGRAHAAVWQDGQRTILADLPGSTGTGGSRINDADQVAGTTLFPLFGSLAHLQATLWNGSQPSALATPAGGDSTANDLNDKGEVVGWTASKLDRSDQVATLWSGTTAIDLNSFLSLSQRSDGWKLLQATAINDLGSIVGSAVNPLTGQTTGFLLAVAVVPEAETGLMLLLGLSGIGVLARRRKATQQALSPAAG